MTERPILFSAEMVRAILDGRKTQTRRVIKPQPPAEAESVSRQLCSQQTPEIDGAWQWWAGKPQTPITKPLFCPYGKPGDLLWVRETWGRTTNVNDSPLWPNRAHIPMHGGEVVIFAADGHWQWCDGDGFATERSFWRPSSNMPRWASRITLRITDVRVERLQDIEGQHPSESDAIAEGVRAIHHGDGDYYYSAFRDVPHPKNWSDPADAFREVWNHINGPGAWEANPWVWAISFERVKP
jgi:hypothetical protein